MDVVLVIENATGEEKLMALLEAAASTHISVEDITFLIESFGRCTSIDHTILDLEAADDLEL